MEFEEAIRKYFEGRRYLGDCDLYESKFGISNEDFNNIKVLTFDNFSEVLTR